MVRAFRKFNRVYRPKEQPVLTNLPTTSTSNFSKGVRQIKDEYFDKAIKNFTSFVDAHPDDCNGIFNLALMQEANDYYKEAIENYKEYLNLCPNATDKPLVEKQITFLERRISSISSFPKRNSQK